MSDIDFGEVLPDGFSSTPGPSPGGGYLFRTGQLLVEPGAVELVTEKVASLNRNVQENRAVNEEGLVLLETDLLEVPEFVVEARTVDHEPVPGVWPNMVFHHQSHMRFFTRLPPRPSEPPAVELPGSEGAGLNGAVIDSGVWDHPWFGGRVTFGTDDLEKPDENGNGALDLAAGHGTFVAGLILQHAPSASVSVRRIPDRAPGGGRTGLVDDVSLAAMLDDVGDEVDVVNVSLGGWAAGDLAPPATAAALARLRSRNPGCVVVAAAGNVPVDRPSWPAAFKGVVAVGALESGQPWDQSARGSWVDAWAEGVDARSTFHEWSGAMEHPDGAVASFVGGALWTGTSFAAPRIAGTIAAKASGHGHARRAASLMLEASPSLGGHAGVVVATSTP
jgi:Subtilase family